MGEAKTFSSSLLAISLILALSPILSLIFFEVLIRKLYAVQIFIHTTLFIYLSIFNQSVYLQSYVSSMHLYLHLLYTTAGHQLRCTYTVRQLHGCMHTLIDAGGVHTPHLVYVRGHCQVYIHLLPVEACRLTWQFQRCMRGRPFSWVTSWNDCTWIDRRKFLDDIQLAKLL